MCFCLCLCVCTSVSFQKAVEKTPLHACLFACLLDCLFACLLVCDCLCVSFQKKSEKTCCCCLMILLRVVVDDLARVAQNVTQLIIDWFYELEKMATTSTTKPQFAFLDCMHILNYYLQTEISNVWLLWIYHCELNCMIYILAVIDFQMKGVALGEVRWELR